MINDLISIPENEPLPRVYRLGDTESISAEAVLYALGITLIKQMDIESVITNSDAGLKIGGTLGNIIAEEIFGLTALLEYLQISGIENRPYLEIEHVYGTPESNEQVFEFRIECRRFKLILQKALGRPDKGYEWGIQMLLVTEYIWTPYLGEEERVLTIKQTENDPKDNPGNDKFITMVTYENRILDSEDPTNVMGGNKKIFVQGNSEAVYVEEMPLKHP